MLCRLIKMNRLYIAIFLLILPSIQGCLHSNEDSEILKLQKELDHVNKKYYKYKNKYHKLKTLTNTETVYNTTIDINNSKDSLEV